ncbi:Tc toxin subunit A-related protein [Cellulophaga baltica]|uniref:Uncharacterized protein n=1 Tax=Cellulophaga baltica 18 TaxID=1348584 RepID=A0AAU8RR17_9FLAO|nr:neuraminidase-like domain-containing protein [Cellulophaga baltica]AIZ40200.1 hypothetical protein M666_00580 [Cellulophaga baltica 18]
MNKQELLQLEKLASLTPKEIEKQKPAMFSKLSERASISLKNTIVAKLKDASPEIKASLKKIDFSPAKLGKVDVKSALAKNLLAGRIPTEKKKKLEEVAAKLPNLGKLDDIIQPEIPVFINPAFQNDLMKAKVYRLSDIVGLSQMKTDKALVKEFSLNTISNAKLDELVKDKILTEKEANGIGLASNLYTLFDSSFELTEHINKSGTVQSIEDLIRLDKSAWKKLVKDSKVELPKDLKPDDYAEILYKKVENLFPGESLVHRISQVKADVLAKDLDAFKPLLVKNKKIFGKSSFDELDTKGLSAAEVKSARVQYEQLDRIIKVNPGLKLNELLDDKNLNPTDKGKKVVERIGLLDKFIKNNAEVNYLAISYTHDSEDVKALNFQGFKPEEKAMVLNSIKTYQRVYSFTNDIEDTETIMAAGFHSSFHITSVTLPDFVKATKLDIAIATKYFENAHMAIIRTTGVMGSILDILTGSFDWTAVGNSSPAIKDYLKDIPGYQDLFGDLAFCDCEHCQSIYSPAAYFVDLMQFVERYIISKHFTGTKATHVLNLKVRRPDLWSLPLTCENTSTLVPYLDIINEILESYIAKKKGYAGDLNDRSLVEEFVYKGEIALEKPGAWKTSVHAFTQPFNLPLETVSTYLGHFEKTREDIAILLGKPQDEISKARLNLSEKEFQLITVPDNTPAFINRAYGITFTVTAGKITPFNAQLLLKPMGIDRKELGRIFKSRFATNNGTDNIIIKGEKIDATSIQNDIERVKNLTYDALDRVHRFVRLWRKTSWSIEELDLILTHLHHPGVATDIIPATISTIGNLLRLQDTLKVSVVELCAIRYSIPTSVWEENQKPLFDILFNHEDVVTSEGSYPKDAIKLIHPALVIDSSTASAEFSSSRLMAGFNRSDDEVLALIQNLTLPLGIVNISSAIESERGFNLTVANLSVLYRHSKFAEILKLSIADLFIVLKLIPTIPNNHIENINHIYEVINFHHWWKSSSFSLDDLNFIVESNDISIPENFKTKEEITSLILDQTQASNSLVFAETVFSSFDDITEELSKAIINANNPLIEPSPDGTNFWLKPSFNPAAAITIPAGITRPEPEIRALLTKYHPQYLIPFHLSGQLQLSEDAISQIISALGIDLDTDSFALELQGITSPAVAIPALVEKLLPLSILFRDKKFNTEALTYIIDHLAIFGIADIDNLSIENIQKLTTFAQFIVLNEDGSHNIVPLTEVLDSFVNATQYLTADQVKLATVLHTKQEQFATIHSVVISSTNAIQALEHYKDVVEVCNYIGIGGDVLPKIISLQYNELNGATNAILAAFRSKYKSESERKEKLEKYQDKLRGRKRASLTTYLIHSGFPQFENENDLFHYFLIDTELEGCARTSRLVAATMSMQLYIHRILLNLEQDDQEPGTLGRVNIGINPENPNDKKYKPIPADEWAWRKNYRVWEANRKVFLYPENYIEPELRDDKSPLFEDLENELLQQDINADTVLDAYAKYMRGFDEVAHLKIAGSYHEKDVESETDVLHLFGVTADEPPIYYYRRIENIYYAEKNENRGIVWGPWQKINVQIPVRKVAPITYNGRLHVFWTRVTTLANAVFDNNRSIFTGYSHKFSIEFATLKLDGTWTPPQKLNLKDCYPFEGNGVVQDPLADDYEIQTFRAQLPSILRSTPFFEMLSTFQPSLRTPRYDTQIHWAPIDEYTLDGFLWDQVYPAIDSDNRLNLTGAGFQLRAAIDFYNLNIQDNAGRLSNITSFEDPVMESLRIITKKAGKIVLRNGNSLHRATSPGVQLFDNFAFGSLVVNTIKSNPLLTRHWNQCTLDQSFNNIEQEQIASLPASSLVQIINGAYGDAIIDVQGDLLLLQGTPVDGNGFILKRLGTTLSETLTRTLFTSGVETTLSIETQKALKEASAPISITPNKIENLVVRDKIDFKGAYGNYYREIFFHIPFLLANYLNSQGKYAEAQKWYHYIFNPSATEVITFPAGLSAAQKKKMELDRNWQYLEFREINTQKLRDQLNDKQAIEVYKKDPFNPHAIARLRMSAYQKSIVMKYIDNLIDWGDQLFSQDTMESVNEATLLYIIAKEILGDRPAQIGGCGEGTVNPKTFENIQPLLNKGSEFLAELESYTYVKTPGKKVRPSKAGILDNSFIYEKSNKVAAEVKYKRGVTYKAAGLGMTMIQLDQMKGVEAKYLPEIHIKPVDDKITGAFAKGTIRGLDWKKDSIYVKDKYRIPSFGISIIKHVSPVFCVPGNKDLLDYYNRVDDRLFKIRNCMNMQGQRRQLALFAPEIDPRLLVRARAAGLSMDDILNSVSGNLPPYRFAYILERAKAFTSVVQSFGASLLSAIEKKNGEELTLLRMTQQQNILEMASKSRKLEIDTANEGIKSLNDRIEAITYQIGYYDSLIGENRNLWEVAQSFARHSASAIYLTESVIDTLSAILHVMPQLGSPFAMKYGGVELGTSTRRFGNAIHAIAQGSEAISASTGLEAGFDRRSEGWKHQKKLLQYELKQTDKNLLASEIRRDILIESEKIHLKNIEHNKDVMEFYGEKFSNLGVYTYLSTTMQRLFKEAYNNALSIAKLAEQAYRYERDDNNIFIDGTYFESSRAGLLAGERLQMALQTMERRYLETNYRKNEIDQAFSLTQIDPSALLLLKQTGTCDFSIPEVFFDLFYPGQYRRKIQSVRLTIPSITGPYTNVSATLSLTGSEIRMEPNLGAAELKEVPKSRTTIISTSTAQNDAGVFQLNFRDDRYMPFEGAGAISSWKLSLPKNFRQFDYSTINDTIIHVSYTAEYDELFRDKVEAQNDAIEGTLINILKNNSLSRTFSLRQEFSNAFHRLTEQPVNNPVLIKIENKHFPLFLNGRNLKVSKAKLILVTSVGQTVASVNINVNGTSQTGFVKDPALGNLFAKDLGNLFNAGILRDHTISIIVGGDLAPTAPLPGHINAIDTEKLEDIILYVEYKIG